MRLHHLSILASYRSIPAYQHVQPHFAYTVRRVVTAKIHPYASESTRDVDNDFFRAPLQKRDEHPRDECWPPDVGLDGAYKIRNVHGAR